MPDDSFIAKRLRPRRLHGAAEPGLPAPFVVGVGRSGTTLLRLMLDAHSTMAVPPETHFFGSLLDASGRVRFGPAQALAAITEDQHRRWNDFGLEPAELMARFEAIPRFNITDALRAFYELYAEKQGKERWGDKTPDYIKRMRRIKRVLPEARFIHVIRDGRDVALSTNKRIIERGHRDPLPAKRSARRWRNRIEKARADGPKLGEYLEIRYEDLVTDTEPTLRRVCQFIELEFEPAMLRYHETAGERLQEM
ncbi:MAG TPA: sulfotransferase, partial [Solirubrobacterales bacterium]|nr:sulfotransferase [Solirubrobacterales bacterium]